MILPKKYYDPFSIAKSFYLIFSSLFLFEKNMNKNKSQDFTQQNVRPRLTAKAKLLVFDWHKVEKSCPVRCIEISEANGKIKKFNLLIKECVGCGICIEQSPVNAIEAVELSSLLTDKGDVISLDLIDELEKKDV